MLVFRLISSFSDYFPSYSYSAIGFSAQRIVVTESSVFMSKCIAENFATSEKGGAIFISTGVLRVLLEDCGFFNCQALEGGVVYFDTTAGSMAMNRVCTNKCKATEYYQFGYFATVDTKNIVMDYFSLTKIEYSNSGQYHSVYLKYAQCQVNNFNYSMNRIHYEAIVFFETKMPIMSFSNLDSNIQISSTVIKLNSKTGAALLRYSNILYSQCKYNSVYIQNTANATIHDCIFLKNYNYTFKAFQSTVYLRLCYIQVGLGTFEGSSSPFSLSNNKFTSTGTLTRPITHIKTYRCHAEIPYENIQAPNPTPRSTPSFSLPNTKAQTPIVTLKPSKMQTPGLTPMLTKEKTIPSTPSFSLPNTKAQTPIVTAMHTISHTLNPSLSNTPENSLLPTPINTLDSTPSVSLPYRTHCVVYSYPAIPKNNINIIPIMLSLLALGK